jgi:hypothetical protein
MKRLFFLLFLIPQICFAASEVIYTSTKLTGGGVQVTANVTAHTDGTVADTQLADSLQKVLTFQEGYALRSLHTYFGSPAPTLDSDFTVEPIDVAYDLLGGAGANTIDAAANNHFRPLAGGSVFDAPVYNSLWLKITGNSVNGAKFKIVFDFIPMRGN